MTYEELLAQESHRLLDVYLQAEVAYHLAPSDNHRQELDAATAADYASRTVARVRAHSIAYKSATAIEHMQNAIDIEQNRDTRGHLVDVMAKLLSLDVCATTDTCASSSAA